MATTTTANKRATAEKPEEETTAKGKAPVKAPAKKAAAAAPKEKATSTQKARTDRTAVAKPAKGAKAPRARKVAEGGDAGADDGAQSVAVTNLMVRGREEGFITHDQILEAIPQPEAQMGAVEELYAAAAEAGVEVLDAENQPTLIGEPDEDVAETPAPARATGRAAAKPKASEEDLEALAADLIGIDDPVRMYL